MIESYKVPPRPSSWGLKIHNKTKNHDRNLNPKNLVKETNTSSPPVFDSNHSILSKYDGNMVSNIVLKYIPYKNRLSGDIPICWPS